MPRLTDTTPEAERVLAEVDRRIPPGRKGRIPREGLRRVRLLHDLGGSLASTLHGTPRQSRDADLSVDPPPRRESEFPSGFGDASYASEDAVRRAARERSRFNVINAERARGEAAS